MGVEVELRLGQGLADSHVSASGFDLLPISIPIAHEFGLPEIQIRGYDPGLWANCNQAYGRVPDWWFLTEQPSGPPWDQKTNRWENSDGTPKRDGFYGDLEWTDRLPRAEKRAVGARLVGMKSAPSILGIGKVRRPSRFAAGENFGIAINESVSESWSRSTTKSWSLAATLGIKYTTGGEVTASKIEVAASITGSYGESRSSGESGSRSKAITHSLSTGFRADAPPNAAIVAQVQGTRSAVQVAVDYEVRLVGACCWWFDKRALNGHKAHSQALDELLRMRGHDNLVRVTETIDMGLVAEGSAVLSDALYDDEHHRYILLGDDGQPTGEEVT